MLPVNHPAAANPVYNLGPIDLPLISDNDRNITALCCRTMRLPSDEVCRGSEIKAGYGYVPSPGHVHHGRRSGWYDDGRSVAVIRGRLVRCDPDQGRC